MQDTPQYLNLQKRLAKGWNTWDTRSLLCWVNLPSAIALNLGLKSYCGVRNHLRDVQVGKQDIKVGDHAYDGSYSDCTLSVFNTSIRIRTASQDDELFILVEPECNALRKSLLIVEIGVLWNNPGCIEHKGDFLYAKSPVKEVTCYTTSEQMVDPHVHSMTPYLALELSKPIGLSTGKLYDLNKIRAIIENREKTFSTQNQNEAPDLNEIKHCIQTCTAWDTIYEPSKKRVVTPVSRFWNDQLYGGYALFCWDTFFAGVLASIDNPDLAHANVVEILREATEDGFVPNVSSGTGRKSRDRSQPPVGSFSILSIYEKYQQKWLLEQCFEALLNWNRWWLKHREKDGYLCWGSTPYKPVIGDRREPSQQNQRFGAALESGLDNSPMYDEIPFDDKDKHILLLADVGLMGLYIADCKALIEIAEILGEVDVKIELKQNSQRISQSLQTLWSEKDGLFLNKRLDTGEFETRLSPTHFYPLIAKAATESQARRMIDEHFFNPDEFWGEWIMPSIAKNDQAYPEQDYWRGRIWAPMNWLVYLGLKNYQNLGDAREAIVEKSKNLLLKEWREKRHIHENYNNETGEGCDVNNSDSFYHWGCLLGMIALSDSEN